MQKLKFIVATSIFLLLVLGVTPSVLADSSHTQQLIIIKYGLSQGATGFCKKDTQNSGLKINNIPTDNFNNELSPVADIHYRIQQIFPKINDFTKISLKKPETYARKGKIFEIKTNITGVANIKLSDGFYIVEELPNPTQHLNTPAQPFLIDLPIWDSEKTELNKVYIYPKSSVDLPLRNPSSQIKNTTKEKGTLPKTGEVQDTLACIIGLGLFGLAFILKKENKDKVRIIENS